jgi:oligopeptide/dipeptide ABC transporter ATP-binding protein
MTAVLELDHLSVRYLIENRPDASAVDDVSLLVEEGEIFALVGESGCGKSSLAMAIMGLLPANAELDGRIRFGATELTTLSDVEWRRLRGDRLGMVFQDPLTSLDPSFGVGDQIAETISAHRRVDSQGARRRAVELLAEVGIPAAARRYGDAPHRFSGGMRQRVVIAAAVANEPALLVADEPTTALDVTIQAQILDLIRGLRDRHRTTILLIAHDLGVVAQLADRVGVMYAGQLVEVGPVAEIFGRPEHPYTRALLAAQPTAAQAPGTLRVIEGQVPDPTHPPAGCRFAPRCPLVMPVCSTFPPVGSVTPGHLVACWASPASVAQAAALGDRA